jgi:hypothetical protein
MKRLILLVAILALPGVPVQASDSDCGRILGEMKLPKKLKTKGKTRIGVVKDVDQTLHNLEQELQGHDCSFTFGQVFQMKNDEDLLPLTNRVIAIAPEDTFSRLTVLTREGEVLGTYAGRVRYERSGNLYARGSYTIYYFQYKDSDGDLHSVGNNLLLDSFGIRWADIRNRTAVSMR